MGEAVSRTLSLLYYLLVGVIFALPLLAASFGWVLP